MAIILFCLAIFDAIALTRASEFLKGSPIAFTERINEEEVRSSLLREIEGTLGEGSASHRLESLEELLRPIYMALPKNQYGKLEHAAGAYALYRLFVLRHGWKMKGLGPDGGSWTSSSPAGFLKHQVPAYIQDLFEQRLEGKGLGLHEIAVLASTIEHLIHTETVAKLNGALGVHNLLPTSTLDAATADEVLDTYMMVHILGENLTNSSLDKVQSLKEDMPEMFTAWKDTQEFVHGVRRNLTRKMTLNSATLTRAAAVVGEQFGSFFSSTQCQIMKQALLKMANPATGRVKLADFYKATLSGAWQFTESVSYLRQLGALDDSVSNELSVVVPNYINSQANCIPTGFYSICCKDDCEGLLGHLEKNIAAPDAAPKTIISLIEGLSSATTSAPRKLPYSLSKRLVDIAAMHGGYVPLHGRLFAQWMHHVYPNECQYPHVSGTTSQHSPDEWLMETGNDPLATQEEMLQFWPGTNSSGSFNGSVRKPESFEKVMPWSPEEELLIVRPSPQFPMNERATPPAIKSAAVFVAAFSVAFALMKSFHARPSLNADMKIFV